MLYYFCLPFCFTNTFTDFEKAITETEPKTPNITKDVLNTVLARKKKIFYLKESFIPFMRIKWLDKRISFPFASKRLV